MNYQVNAHPVLRFDFPFVPSYLLVHHLDRFKMILNVIYIVEKDVRPHGPRHNVFSFLLRKQSRRKRFPLKDWSSWAMAKRSLKALLNLDTLQLYPSHQETEHPGTASTSIVSPAVGFAAGSRRARFPHL